MTQATIHPPGRWLLLLIPPLLAACSPGDAKLDEPEPALPVIAATASLGVVHAAYQGTATIEAEAEAVVVARIGGVVEAIAVEEGERVEADQVLARLDDERLRLEAARALATRQQLENDYQRIQKVLARDLVSREQFDRVRFEWEAARAAHALAELNVRETVIRAPFSGVVARRHIKLGNTVATGEPAFRITRMDRLEARLHVPERDIHTLAPGQRAELAVDAWPERRFTGSVDRIAPVVDAETGTVAVTVALTPDQDGLRPGMFGRLRIVHDRREDALLIPREAVLSEDAAEAVFVVRDGTARRQAIRSGYREGAHVEVLEGLVVGDRVVTTGQSSLKDGARVEVIPADAG